MKKLLLGAGLAVVVAGNAYAVPVDGSFSAFGSGAYLNNSNAAATAGTATRLDFGPSFSGGGNGFGTAGTVLVVTTSGSFVPYAGMFGTINDIQFGSAADPTTATPEASPFLSFGSGALTLDFSSAVVARSSNGTGVNITGTGTFASAGDSTPGTFALTTTSSGGVISAATFTFTTSAQALATPEPMSLSLLGAALAWVGLARLRRKN